MRIHLRLETLNVHTSTMRTVASSISSSSKLFRVLSVPLLHGINTKAVRVSAKSRPASLREKRRTRSDREFELDEALSFGHAATHVPVMLGEVSDVFGSTDTRSLRSFVDCTVGAAGHSSAIIQSHPELRCYVGLDVDPVAHEKAVARINSLLDSDSFDATNLKTYTFLKNFRHVKAVLSEVDETLVDSGVDGVLMDLGMSSMQVNSSERGFSILGDGPLDMRMDPQASLKAEDILNTWPDSEVGRILRDYGEESNWYFLQNKIVKARLCGGLHSTGELVDLIRRTSWNKGGRQGWIKTATRVFQALRIAVNDELKILEDSLQACFDCLMPGGRLAVISFHSLEDRIVKQTFLEIIGSIGNDYRVAETGDKDSFKKHLKKKGNEIDEKESWIKQTIQGSKGTILTKRPITPSAEEEKLNGRSRSAKLRVIEKTRVCFDKFH